MKKEKNNKKKNVNWNKILLITLLVLLLIEIVLIPCLIYAEVKKVLPIIGFLVLPTLCCIAILLLSRNCFNDYENKKDRLSKRIIKDK